MKKIILATVSGFALLGASAFAADETQPQAQQPTTSNEAAAMSQAAAKPAETAPAAEAAPAAKATAHKKHHAHHKAHHGKPEPRLTARHHNLHHMGHYMPDNMMMDRMMAHGYARHPGYTGYPHYVAGENVIVDGKYIAFPPVDVYGRIAIAPAYFLGKKDCPYVCHGGYFWYPHVQATLLKGYTPYQYGNYYWYASHMHPHAVYVQRTHPAFVYPYPLTMDAETYMTYFRG